jgi:hypothetical protein
MKRFDHLQCIYVPQFISTGNGLIINLYLATEICLWQITKRNPVLNTEDAAQSVSPYEWVDTPRQDRYITISFGSDPVEPTYQFYDGGVKPVANMGSVGSAIELFKFLFPFTELTSKLEKLDKAE